MLVSVAPGLVPRSDLTPDWLETLVGLARSPGTGLVGALIADDDEIIVHAGWDEPNHRGYRLEGVRVAAPSSGNDLLIERECTHVSLAAAAVSASHWREGRATAVGGFDAAGRALSSTLARSGARTVWTPYAALRRGLADRSLASTTISPRFSIITPVYNPPLGAFQECIDSVRSQTLTDWEWCIVDDGSTQPGIRAALETAAAEDPRIRFRASRHQRRHRRRVEQRTRHRYRRVRRLSGPRRSVGTRQRSSRWPRPSMSRRTSTTCTATRPTCTPTAASSPISRSRIGAPNGSGRRCTPATCRSCAAMWSTRSVASARASTARRITT